MPDFTTDANEYNMTQSFIWSLRSPLNALDYRSES